MSREQVRDSVAALADHTIRYCLQEPQDPRPALTAASAAYNMLEQMLLTGGDTYSMQAMREQLEVMDFCISRHMTLLSASLEGGQWEFLSPQRQQEVLDRSRFSMKLREAAETAIQRLEAEQHSTANHTGS